MAVGFEGIYRFIDEMRARYENEGNPLVYMFVLSSFLSEVLKHAKFKHQREYCISVMREMNPSYCEGYFKKRLIK